MITDLIVDVDGTLVDTREMTKAWLNGELPGSLAEHAVYAPPIKPVVAWVKAHAAAGARVHIVTARYDSDARWTGALLDRLGIVADTVTHRPPGRFRIDTAYKRHWVQTRIASHLTTLAIDDNPYVIDMYEQIGIPVIQVPGWDRIENADPQGLVLPEVSHGTQNSPSL